MAMPNPVYTASPIYASPAVPQMHTASPYYNGPSPFNPILAQQQTPGHYPPMGAMHMGGQPVMVQQPHPMYQRQGCCCNCCYGDCNCCLGLFATLCFCCFCCNETDECCF